MPNVSAAARPRLVSAGLCLAVVLAAPAGRRAEAGQPPTLPARPTIIVTGQSNAIGLSAVLGRDAEVFGLALGGRSISCWAAGRDCWGWLVPEIDLHPNPPHAFVWWQGETDQDEDDSPRLTHPPDYYTHRLTDVIRRARAKVRNPTLLVLIVELGPHHRGRAVTQETLKVIARDRNAGYVKTSDLPFADETHMGEKGYVQVSKRIQAMIRAHYAKLRRGDSAKR